MELLFRCVERGGSGRAVGPHEPGVCLCSCCGAGPLSCSLVSIFREAPSGSVGLQVILLVGVDRWPEEASPFSSPW